MGINRYKYVEDEIWRGVRTGDKGIEIREKTEEKERVFKIKSEMGMDFDTWLQSQKAKTTEKET